MPVTTKISPDLVGKIAARVYSPSRYRRLLSCNPDQLTGEIKAFNAQLSAKAGSTVSEFYQSLYQLQLKYYRNEYVYKNLITRKILLGKHSLNTTVQMGEFAIGRSIADIIMVNGRCEVYEIKTELDSPVKLKTQLKDYTAFSPYINIVTHENIAVRYENIAKQEGLGLWLLTNRNQLRMVQEPIFRPEGLNVEVMMRSLRKPEYDAVLAANFGTLGAVPGIQYFRERFALARQMEPYKFHMLMLDVLKGRQLKKPVIFQHGCELDPFYYLLYALNLTEKEYLKFNIFVNQPL